MIQSLLDYLKNIFMSKEEYQRLCSEQDKWVEEMNAKQLSEWLEENRNLKASGVVNEFTDDVPF